MKRGSGGGRAARSALCGLALGAVAVQARVAVADPAASGRAVYLERTACDATAPGEVASILRVELFDRTLEGPTQDAYRAAMECSGDLVVISVGARAGASRSLRTSLAGVPANVRARVVALAIAELVRDLDREPPPPPARRDRVPPPVAPHPAPASTPAEAPASRGVELGAFAETSTFRLDGAWLTGGGLRFDYAVRRFCVGLDAALLTSTERFDLGTARALLAYGSPFAAWQERWGRAQVRLGAGYALGAARLSAQASDPRAFAGTTTGPWTAPYGFAALALRVTEGLGFEARGRLGWVTSPVVGQVSSGGEVALEGLWASVEVGVAIGL